MAGSLKRNLLWGLLGGLAGTAAMDAYWAGISKLRPPSRGSSSEEPATVKLARRVLRSAGVKSPSLRTRSVGGQIVHWSYGASWGLATGAARSAGVPLEYGFGLLLGMGLWAGGDVWLTWKLGLAKHPSEYPTHVHLASLAAHLAYGAALWATIDGLDKLGGEKKRIYRRVA